MPANVASRSWDQIIPPLSRARIVIVGVLLIAGYWRVIELDLVDRWMNDANWSHGWLIPVFSLYVLYAQRDRLAACRAKPSYVGAVILLASLGICFLSAWRLRMAYPQDLSLVGSILGLVVLLGGWNVLRATWFPIVFLFLAIPLPHSVYVDVTMPLRQLASQVAALVMPMFAPGLHTDAQSVVIDYVMPGRGAGQLNVEEACSGMRSIMAFVTLGVAIAYVHERPVWQRLLLLASCVPIAVFCNTIRVTVTGLLFVYGRTDLATGTPHTLLGVLMFALALALFSGLGWLLAHLFVEERVGDGVSGRTDGGELLRVEGR